MAARRTRPVDAHALRDDMAELLRTDIFSSAEATGPLFRAAYLWFVVNLHDLLGAVATPEDPVVLVVDGEDVVDLIRRARYALVHGAAAYRRGPDDGPTVTILLGEASGHPDDIAIEIGGIRLLLRRHAVDAFEAAHARLEARAA